MVFHIVLFDPRTDLREEEREAVFAAFGRALAAIPSVRRAHVGRRVRHGAGYEAGMGEPLEYAAVLVFDDLDGLRTYLEHPAHATLANDSTPPHGPAWCTTTRLPRTDGPDEGEGCPRSPGCLSGRRYSILLGGRRR
jgi:hypothetical protein